MKAIEDGLNGDKIIYDGKRVIGSLISLGDDKFKIRIGEFGGFYNVSLSFNDALDKLITADIKNYTSRLRSIKTGANLIYKKSLKKKYEHNS